MGLDYSGKTSFKKDRDLLAARKSFYAKDSIPLKTGPSPAPEADEIFDGLTRVFLKGEALRKGLSEMAPAAYIPVDVESAVIAAIQRVAPAQGNFKIITYGLFMEACDGLSKRAGAIDEEFMSTNAKIIDESQLARVITRTVKGQSDTHNDQLSAFLDSLIPLAGVILAGYMSDVATTSGGKMGIDSGGDSGEVLSTAGKGSMLGWCYLIELGMTLAIFLYVYSDMGMDPKMKDDFERLENDPEERKKIFEDAGVDYEKVRKNQRWNDYKAIKEYSIKYVHRNSDTGQYDHWIAYTAILDQQSAIRSSLAMAPKFSEKWQGFYERGGSFSTAPVDVAQNAEDIFETAAHAADAEAAASTASNVGSSAFGDMAGQMISELSVGLKSYLHGLITASSDVYNRTVQAFYFTMDERMICCLIYFVGPINTDILYTISSALKLFLIKISFSISDFIENLINSIFNIIINMLNTYLHQLVSQIIDKIYKVLAKIPTLDLDQALIYCLGLEIILKILDEVTAMILGFVADIIEVLESLVITHRFASIKFMEITVEKRCMFTLAAMLEALARKIDDMKDLCARDQETDVEYQFRTTGSIDEITAMKAINFVQEELPHMFPILDLPEDVRRKHFSDIDQFSTERLGVPVAGFDDIGGVDYEDLVQGCADNSPATKLTELANKIATAINEGNDKMTAQDKNQTGVKSSGDDLGCSTEE